MTETALIRGLPTETAYETVLALNQRELLLLDYAGTELSLLVQIDETRAWPGVKDLVSEGADYKIREVLKHLSPGRSREVIHAWVQHGAAYVWYVKDQIESILGMANANVTEKLSLLQTVEDHLRKHRESDERTRLLNQVRAVRQTLSSTA